MVLIVWSSDMRSRVTRRSDMRSRVTRIMDGTGAQGWLRDAAEAQGWWSGSRTTGHVSHDVAASVMFRKMVNKT